MRAKDRRDKSRPNPNRSAGSGCAIVECAKARGFHGALPELVLTSRYNTTGNASPKNCAKNLCDANRSSLPDSTGNYRDEAIHSLRCIRPFADVWEESEWSHTKLVRTVNRFTARGRKVLHHIRRRRRRLSTLPADAKSPTMQPYDPFDPAGF